MPLVKCSECERDISEKASVCPHCGCPVVLVTPSINVQNDILKAEDKHKKKTIRIIIIAIACLVTIISLVMCFHFSKSFQWNDVILNAVLPEPPTSQGVLQSNRSDYFYLIAKQISFSEYEEYVSKCIDAGYVYSVRYTSDSYTAFNRDGYELTLDYFEYNENMSISLDVRISGIFNWPINDLSASLPIPSSNKGRIVNNNTSRFEVYVGYTTKAEYEEYTSACEVQGYELSVSKTDNSFCAQNENGYSLEIEYFECDLIHITLDAPEIENNDNGSNASSTMPSSATDTPTQYESDDIDHPQVGYDSFNLTDQELIEWMNSYSEFVVSDIAIDMNSTVNTGYAITMDDGTIGMLILNHGEPDETITEGIKSDSVRSIMVYFEDMSSALTIVIWTANHIDARFSTSDAISKTTAGESYSSANMTVMYLEDSKIAVLAPTTYIVKILEE